MTTVHFDDDAFQFGTEVALGASYRQAADVGEVLGTAGRIKDGDADSWLDEWTSTAGTVWSAAEVAARDGHPVSALAHHRRAATYYAAALYRVRHSSESERELGLWRRQRACWDRIVDLTGGQRFPIRYDGTTLPGYFFRAPDAGPEEVRPLVVVNNGSDGATSQAWVSGGAAAADRGFHWATFDGPGQQAALVEQHLSFRPDWEQVLTPVLDTLLARPDVDTDRVAVIGVGQGGYWVARTLAFEHRFAAAVLDPGVVDVSTAWTDPLSPLMRKHLDEGDRDSFDREMHLGELFCPALASTLRCRGEPYGVASESRFELYRTVRQYRLGEAASLITTPTLVTDPEGEQFWPGQSRQLYDQLRAPKELAGFAARHGAGRHGEPLGPAVRETRIFDWLEQYLRPPGRAA